MGKVAENSKYYEEARRFARLISQTARTSENCNFVIVTGGGPRHYGSGKPRRS